MSTQLLERIRKDRGQRKVKQTLKSTRFARIGWIVREYALGMEILTEADRFIGTSLRQKLAIPRVRMKKRFAPPPFVVLTKEEYAIATSIMKKIDNPYLDFVSSPEEVVLAGPLYRRNPSLSIARLHQYHFETLLLYELAREEVRGLMDHVASLDVRVAELMQEGGAMEKLVAKGAVVLFSNELIDREMAQLNLGRERVERLLKFLSKIEDSPAE